MNANSNTFVRRGVPAVLALALVLVGAAQPAPPSSPSSTGSSASFLNAVSVTRLSPIPDFETLLEDAFLQGVADDVAAYCAQTGSDVPEATDLARFLADLYGEGQVLEDPNEYKIVIIDGEPVTVCVVPREIQVSDGSPLGPVVVSVSPTMPV